MTTYSPGIHLIQLPDLKRQFLLAVPHELAQSPGGVPLVMTFHGFSDSPWYTNAFSSMSLWLDRYGWLGIFPFGLNEEKSNGLGGIQACCPPGCDDECCKNGRHLNKKDHSACRWDTEPSSSDFAFVEAIVKWAAENTVVDTTKVFATGFSMGGMFTNSLYCEEAQLFRAVAPISGDNFIEGCSPARPISYISMCGSEDDEAHCQYFFKSTAEQVSRLNSCTGQGPSGEPIEENRSATTKCKQWSNCKDGNFVEWCETTGLSHDVSGHLRPDDISYIRPASDLDIVEYVLQKFSLFAGHSILFDGHPTKEDLAIKQSSWPPPTLDDHLYLRRGRLLGKDEIA